MLGPRPDLAAEQAREILKVAPGHAQALFLLASALRMQGEAREALPILETLVRALFDDVANNLARYRSLTVLAVHSSFRRPVTATPRSSR